MQSRTVQFQNFTLDILAADNSQIKYKVVRDRQMTTNRVACGVR
jgi:hypothetical protein